MNDSPGSGVTCHLAGPVMFGEHPNQKTGNNVREAMESDVLVVLLATVA